MGLSAETPPKRMAAGKPHPLHNFTMPVLQWGNRRIIRFVHENPKGETFGSSPAGILAPSDAGSAGFNSLNLSGVRNPSTLSPPEKLQKPQPPPRLPESWTESSDAKIEKIGGRMVVQTATDQMWCKAHEEREEGETSPPWNLKRKLSVLNGPETESGVSAVAVENSTRFRSKRLAAAVDARIKKTKLSISLSRKEIEDDFFLMTGSKPRRRPKKRAKIIQKKLDVVFPGLLLSNITLDTYKVVDLPAEAAKILPKKSQRS